MPMRPLALVALTLASTARVRAAATPAAATISDANIAAIVVTANTIDIQYADMALAKSQRAEVREFAEMVRKDHQSVNEAAGDTVVWINRDIVRHNAVARGRFDSGELRGGERHAWVAADTGRHEYRCTIHQNMRGVVRVQSRR